MTDSDDDLPPFFPPGWYDPENVKARKKAQQKAKKEKQKKIIEQGRREEAERKREQAEAKKAEQARKKQKLEDEKLAKQHAKLERRKDLKINNFFTKVPRQLKKISKDLSKEDHECLQEFELISNGDEIAASSESRSINKTLVQAMWDPIWRVINKTHRRISTGTRDFQSDFYEKLSYLNGHEKDLHLWITACKKVVLQCKRNQKEYTNPWTKIKKKFPTLRSREFKNVDENLYYICVDMIHIMAEMENDGFSFEKSTIEYNLRDLFFRIPYALPRPAGDCFIDLCIATESEL
tara:strand:- start:186 stop:1064 length:879 start_codon:yes stop_codon:yes gene_type:complete